jgi:hypothetical protein
MVDEKKEVLKGKFPYKYDKRQSSATECRYPTERVGDNSE